MSKILVNLKSGDDFAAISLGKPRYFGSTNSDFVFYVDWGDGTNETVSDYSDGGVQSFTKKIIVKVEDRGSGNKFYLYDGNSGDEVDLTKFKLLEGMVYSFDQSDSSNNGHPLELSSTNNGSAFSSNVTASGTAGVDRVLEFTIDKGASLASAYSSGVWFNCGAPHPNMGSVIGAVDVDQQSVTLWHSYDNKNARLVQITGGFGASSNPNQALPICLAEESERSPCSSHERITKIRTGGGKSLHIHGHGDFADMPLTECNATMVALDSADPTSVVLKTSGDDGVLNFINTWKGNHWSISWPVKNFYNNTYNSGVTVKSVSGMFQDQPNNNMAILNANNTATIEDMSFLFKNNKKYNRALSLNVTSVTNFEGMFEGSIFNNVGVSAWNVQAGTNFKDMFKDSAFNQNIVAWFRASAGASKDISGMFENAKYNRNITNWKTSSVNKMDRLFKDNTVYSGQLYWDVSGVTSMESVFENSTFNGQGPSAWLPTSCSNFKNALKGSKFKKTINNWFKNLGANCSLEGLFEDTTYNLAVIMGNSNVVNTSKMFKNNTAFTQNAYFTMDNVTDASSMFDGAKNFNGQGVGGWNMQKCENLNRLFASSKYNRGTPWFNSSAGVSKTMSGLFEDTVFNQNIATWNMSTVTDTSFMFRGNRQFNQAIGGWNTSAVTDMRGMFEAATAFNRSLRNWDIKKVVSMRNMFKNNTKYNFYIATWFNVAGTYAIEDMSGMFDGATAFSQDLRPWSQHKATLKEAKRFIAENKKIKPFFIRDFGKSATALERVDGFFSNSINIAGQVSHLAQWNVLSDGDKQKEQKNFQKGNTFRGKIGGFDFTANEDSTPIDVPDFPLPDPIPNPGTGLNCHAIIAGNPGDDTLNSIYIRIV